MSTYHSIELILNPQDPPEYILEVEDFNYKVIHTKTSQIIHPGGKLKMKIEKALVEAAIPEIEELYEKYSKKGQVYIKVDCTSEAFSKKAEKDIKCKYKIEYRWNPYTLKEKMKESNPTPEPIVEEKNYTEIILLSL